VRATGGELKAFYLVMDRYDAVLIAEAPDEETATRFALATGARGFVRTEALRAYTGGGIPEDHRCPAVRAHGGA